MEFIRSSKLSTNKKKVNFDPKKSLKLRSRTLKPIAWIGKQGITISLKKELTRQLEQKNLIKVKLLRNYLDEVEDSRKEIISSLAKELNAELIENKGLTFVLYKKPKFKDFKKNVGIKKNHKSSNNLKKHIKKRN